MKILEKKRFDFLKVYRQKPEKTKEIKARIRRVWLITALAAVFAGVFAGLKYREAALQRKINEASAYLYDPARMAQLADQERITAGISSLSDLKESLEKSLGALRTPPAFDSEFFATMESRAADIVGIRSYGYTEQTGSLTITAVANSVEGASRFVRILEESGDFLGVHYYGYQQEGAAGSYQFTVSCMMPPSSSESGAN